MKSDRALWTACTIACGAITAAGAAAATFYFCLVVYFFTFAPDPTGNGLSPERAGLFLLLFLVVPLALFAFGCGRLTVISNRKRSA